VSITHNVNLYDR